MLRFFPQQNLLSKNVATLLQERLSTSSTVPPSQTSYQTLSWLNALKV